MDSEDRISLKPGMSYTVDAGAKLIIEDQNGEALEIEGRDDPKVMEFLEAFDVWLTTDRANLTGIVLDAAYQDMLNKFNTLPGRIQAEMPSIKTSGVIVRGHQHA